MTTQREDACTLRGLFCGGPAREESYKRALGLTFADMVNAGLAADALRPHIDVDDACQRAREQGEAFLSSISEFVGDAHILEFMRQSMEESLKLGPKIIAATSKILDDPANYRLTLKEAFNQGHTIAAEILDLPKRPDA